MARVYNFSAGPAMLPEEVLTTAAAEMLDYQNTGMSVMEMSHRSTEYQHIIGSAQALLRELMSIPNNYEVLFLQGGASSQFAMVPLNLMSPVGKADYVDTGVWSNKAINEAKRYGEVKVVASSESQNFLAIPPLQRSLFRDDADYVHITYNNTIYGTKFTQLPDTGTIPLVADMSSCILSQQFDVSQFACIYAGAQKNIGMAGVTLIIVRKDLLGKAHTSTPTMFNYQTHAKSGSMYNTPPSYGIYIAKLVFDWIKAQGGVRAMQSQNEQKSSLFYNFLDRSQLFYSLIKGNNRSLMNIPFEFQSTSEPLKKQFLTQAKAHNLVNLTGHRLVGGMRASFYNAMPLKGVQALIAFMQYFEAQHKINN